MTVKGTWGDEVAKRLDSMVALRRDFHRHPELSFQEKRTAQIIAERLSAAKLEVKTFFKGLYAPKGGDNGTREGIRQEVFILYGSPTEMVKAAAKLDKLLK